MRKQIVINIVENEGKKKEEKKAANVNK